MDPQQPDEEDYAHTHDRQAQRTRTELWVILAAVIAVLAASLVWRAATGRHAGPQEGWGPTKPVPANVGGTPAAGAGVSPHGVGSP